MTTCYCSYLSWTQHQLTCSIQNVELISLVSEIAKSYKEKFFWIFKTKDGHFRYWLELKNCQLQNQVIDSESLQALQRKSQSEYYICVNTNKTAIRVWRCKSSLRVALKWPISIDLCGNWGANLMESREDLIQTNWI